MAKSIDFAADASWLAALLLSYTLAVCALVAPCQPDASTAIIDFAADASRLAALLLSYIPASTYQRGCRLRRALPAGCSRAQKPKILPRTEHCAVTLHFQCVV